MSTHALLLLNHNIALKEARDYGNVSAQALHLRAKALHGIGYPISGDALAIEYQRERALYALQTIGDTQDAQGAKP